MHLYVLWQSKDESRRVAKKSKVGVDGETGSNDQGQSSLCGSTVASKDSTAPSSSTVLACDGDGDATEHVVQQEKSSNRAAGETAEAETTAAAAAGTDRDAANARAMIYVAEQGHEGSDGGDREARGDEMRRSGVMPVIGRRRSRDEMSSSRDSIASADDPLVAEAGTVVPAKCQDSAEESKGKKKRPRTGDVTSSAGSGQSDTIRQAGQSETSDTGGIQGVLDSHGGGTASSSTSVTGMESPRAGQGKKRKSWRSASGNRKTRLEPLDDSFDATLSPKVLACLLDCVGPPNGWPRRFFRLLESDQLSSESIRDGVYRCSCQYARRSGFAFLSHLVHMLLLQSWDLFFSAFC